jgi:hypothetical protein
MHIFMLTYAQVGEDLVPKILSVNGNGQSVEFLTTDKVGTR